MYNDIGPISSRLNRTKSVCSVMHSDRNSVCGDVVLDSANMAVFYSKSHLSIVNVQCTILFK